MTKNPFDADPPTLDSNPFEPASSHNPFEHPNDSAFSLDSQDTARGNAYSVPAGADRNFDDRERQLREREAELADRQREVERRERDVGVYQNNWPPFFPFIHHDITTVPDDYRTAAKLLYFQWLALAATLVFNLLGCIFLLVAGSSEGGADVAASGAYLPFIGVASFFLWYRPIYLGFRNSDNGGKAVAFFFYVFFLFAGFNLLFSIYMAIGIPSTGSAGLINTISMFSQGHILAGIFGAISSFGWVLQAAGGGLMYKRVWDFKNGNADITFAEATNQLKHNSLKTIILHQAGMT